MLTVLEKDLILTLKVIIAFAIVYAILIGMLAALEYFHAHYEEWGIVKTIIILLLIVCAAFLCKKYGPTDLLGIGDTIEKYKPIGFRNH